eukprot:GDKJ01042712.1.p1 GENE.GDKJ01042712.1~~GDKJ01042712.1.p1  ORF type:complete len:225 (+),score=15.75 GDKJ01042712.1:32-706(+)
MISENKSFNTDDIIEKHGKHNEISTHHPSPQTVYFHHLSQPCQISPFVSNNTENIINLSSSNHIHGDQNLESNFHPAFSACVPYPSAPPLLEPHKEFDQSLPSVSLPQKSFSIVPPFQVSRLTLSEKRKFMTLSYLFPWFFHRCAFKYLKYEPRVRICKRINADFSYPESTPISNGFPFDHEMSRLVPADVIFIRSRAKWAKIISPFIFLTYVFFLSLFLTAIF